MRFVNWGGAREAFLPGARARIRWRGKHSVCRPASAARNAQTDARLPLWSAAGRHRAPVRDVCTGKQPVASRSRMSVPGPFQIRCGQLETEPKAHAWRFEETLIITTST